MYKKKTTAPKLIQPERDTFAIHQHVGFRQNFRRAFEANHPQVPYSNAVPQGLGNGHGSPRSRDGGARLTVHRSGVPTMNPYRWPQAAGTRGGTPREPAGQETSSEEAPVGCKDKKSGAASAAL